MKANVFIFVITSKFSVNTPCLLFIKKKKKRKEKQTKKKGKKKKLA